MENNVINDSNCCSLLSAGSSEAYYYLIRIYFPVLCNFSLQITKDKMAAEDIVTDVFIKIWQQKVVYPTMEELKKVLYTAVKNGSLNYLRSQKRAQQRHEVFTSQYFDEDQHLVYDITTSELMAEVRKALDSLPKKMRTVFILSYIKQLSNDQIASELNISNQTVRNQKTRSLIRLREKLGPQALAYLILIELAIS